MFAEEMVAPFYLVVDVEATCADDGSIPPEEMETIEIGAVMLDGESREAVSEFQTFVKPARHPTLTRFCTELTSIQQSDVDAAPGFPAAAEAFAAWLTQYQPLVFCSWGAWDEKQLRKDAAVHDIPWFIPGPHVNLKAEFPKRAGGKKRVGVSRALIQVGLEFQGTAHRGIDDARNIARLVSYCLA